MATQKGNSAVGTVTSAPDSIYSPENLLRYHTTLALLEKLTQDGQMSQRDYRRSCTILRCKYGLPSGSIFAETA